MKVAIPTDDGIHVSDKFGHVQHFFVMDIKANQTEMRHNDTEGEVHRSHRHMRADKVLVILSDVDVVITSHIGKPMIERMLSAGKILYSAKTD